ncbi:hypothetical protein [Burkholderia seminalis]|nr:hypothetical protein [Burkholderia seminalis]
MMQLNGIFVFEIVIFGEDRREAGHQEPTAQSGGRKRLPGFRLQRFW